MEKLVELFKKYVRKGMAISFDSLFELAKAKKIYNNKNDLEMDLERLMDEGLVSCKQIQLENRFMLNY